jgi:hypothetical protein
MNHPTKEDLISLLYDELPSDRQAELNSHLETCGECRSQVAEWKKVQRQLREWRLPGGARNVIRLPRAAWWAAAAVFMVCLGFAAGRFSLGQPDGEKLRATIEMQLRQVLADELKGARDADRKQIIAMLKDIEEQRLSDYTRLRKDLETVAVIADEKLTTTERVLRQANLFTQTEVNNHNP